MCLTIYCSNRAERRHLTKNPLVAKKDFYVWKRFRPTSDKKILSSPYQYFPYERGYIYSNGITKPFGFNSERYNPRKVDIHEGLHAYLKNERHQLNWGEVMIKCIVPKGSLYYKNRTEIVTNNLIIP